MSLEPSEERFVLILERHSSKPDAEIGRLLSYHLGLHPTDAIAGVRYGGGLLASELTLEVARALEERLRAIGVEARRVPADRWALVPRGYRAVALQFAGEVVLARLRGTRTIEIPIRNVFGVHLFGLLPPRPEGSGPGRASKVAAARLTESKGKREILDDPSLPWTRGRELFRKLAEQDLAAMEFHLALCCADPIGPVRVARKDFDFTSLGARMEEYSLDNFLVLLEEVLACLPHAWNRRTAERFLEDLEPAKLLYFKEEEAENFERWMFQWDQLQLEQAVPEEREPAGEEKS